jgi:hypothetical protein
MNLRRFWGAALGLQLVGLSANGGTQDRPPQVRVWLYPDGQIPYGSPVRVWFEVSQDAYVVVGRVSGDGRMALLFPAGGGPLLVRRGAARPIVNLAASGGASFRASPGAGYVFALASRSPFDLRAMRGVYAGRYTARGWQDPDWLVQQLAAAALWEPDAPYDYDIAYYQVPLPRSFARRELGYCDPALGYPYIRPGPPYPWPRDRRRPTSDCWYYSPSGSEPQPGRIQSIPAPRDSKGANIGVIRRGLWRPDTVSPVTEPDPRLPRGRSNGSARPPD